MGVAVTDVMTGLYTKGAILAALLERQSTGMGQKVTPVKPFRCLLRKTQRKFQIDANLLSTQLATLVNVGGNFLNGGLKGQRWGTAHESIVPYQAFRVRSFGSAGSEQVTINDCLETADDRYLVVGAGNDGQFGELLSRIGMEELKEDGRFATNALRVQHRDVLIPILQVEKQNQAV